MKIIGITGGIGAGKSQVLDYLHEKYGATICKADEIGKQVQEKGTECFDQIVTYFGTDIVGKDGQLDREKLGAIVFQDEEKLKALNQIVHPAVKKEIYKIVGRERAKGTSLFLLESAILIETSYTEICDEIWFVYVRQENRLNRLVYSRGYSPEKVESIFAAQLSKQDFLKNCDRVIDNNSVFEVTANQLDEILSGLLEE